jgi:hypothetical protein
VGQDTRLWYVEFDDEGGAVGESGDITTDQVEEVDGGVVVVFRAERVGEQEGV